jgi:hypothetical protein
MNKQEVQMINRNTYEFAFHIQQKIIKEELKFAKKYNLLINKNGCVNGNSLSSLKYSGKYPKWIGKYLTRLAKIFNRSLRSDKTGRKWIQFYYQKIKEVK